MIEAQRKGRRVKTLEDRPTLPAHLAIVAQARQDIGEGSDVGSVAQWFQAAGVAPTSREVFWLLDRLRVVEAAHFAGSSNG